MTEHEVLQLLDNAIDYFGVVMQDKDVDTTETARALAGLDTAWRLARSIRRPQPGPMTAEQVAQVMDDYLQKVKQVAQVPPMILDGTTITGFEPPEAPPIAHLGEMVHVKTSGGSCLAALTVIPGPAPKLQVFFHNQPDYLEQVPHWTNTTDSAWHRWHCACECAQATATP